MFESFILAGGKSTRMKRDKAFIKLGGKTLLERSFLTLQKINSKNISVVIAENSGKFENFRVITDIYKDRGTLSGIHSALANCNEKFALIIAVDHPFISSELLNFILKIAENEDADCIAPIQKDGIIQPLCGVYQTQKCLKILTSIFEEFNETPSARDFVKHLNPHLVEFSEISQLPNADNFFLNINTPEDFEQAKRINLRF